MTRKVGSNMEMVELGMVRMGSQALVSKEILFGHEAEKIEPSAHYLRESANGMKFSDFLASGNYAAVVDERNDRVSVSFTTTHSYVYPEQGVLDVYE